MHPINTSNAPILQLLQQFTAFVLSQYTLNLNVNIDVLLELHDLKKFIHFRQTI